MENSLGLRQLLERQSPVNSENGLGEAVAGLNFTRKSIHANPYKSHANPYKIHANPYKIELCLENSLSQAVPQSLVDGQCVS